MVEFLLLIAMLIYRSAMCVCVKIVIISSTSILVRLGKPVLRTFIARIWHLGWHSHPIQKKAWSSIIQQGICFFSKRKTPPKWQKAVVFWGPGLGPLCASNLKGVFFNQKMCYLMLFVRLKGKGSSAQFIQKQPKKKVLGFNHPSDVSILEKTNTPRISRFAWFFFVKRSVW